MSCCVYVLLCGVWLRDALLHVCVVVSVLLCDVFLCDVSLFDVLLCDVFLCACIVVCM